MGPLTDYEEQISSIASRISNRVINATRRIVCYHQPIYDDTRLEPIEYAGLGLSANSADFLINPSSVLTTVKPMYHNSVICIVDDDSKFKYYVQYVSHIAEVNTITMYKHLQWYLHVYNIITHFMSSWFLAVAVVGLERIFYEVSENVGVVELCAVVYQPVNIECPIALMSVSLLGRILQVKEISM